MTQSTRSAVDADPAPTPDDSRRVPPMWLVESVDMLERRRGLLLGVVGVIVAVAATVAVVRPGLLPPTFPVGAALGIAALLLGVAAVVATDAADATIRGPRHVTAAGGELVAVLPRGPDPDRAEDLARAVLEARREDAALLLGIASAGHSAERVTAWSKALAQALASSGASVLHVDLASGRSDPPGMLEVVRAGGRISSAVRFEPGLRLAWLGAGEDRGAALDLMPYLRDRLPTDLDVLVVALPPVGSRQVLQAASSLDHVVLVVERDVTARVDLIASLDAVDTIGASAQVALLDDRTAGVVVPAIEQPSTPADEPEVTAADEPEVTTTGDPDVTAGDPDEPDVDPYAGLSKLAEVSTDDTAGTDAPPADDAPAGSDAPPADEDTAGTDAAPAADEGIGRRDVEVLLGSTEAHAVQLAESGGIRLPPEPAATTPPEHDEPEPDDPAATTPPGPAATTPPESEPPTGPADDGVDQSDTQRITEASDPRASDEDEDLLRTTARLAVLLEDLEGRQPPPR